MVAALNAWAASFANSVPDDPRCESRNVELNWRSSLYFRTLLNPLMAGRGGGGGECQRQQVFPVFLGNGKSFYAKKKLFPFDLFMTMATALNVY